MNLKNLPFREALKQIHRIQKYPTNGIYAQVSLNLLTEDLIVDEVGQNSSVIYRDTDNIFEVWTFEKNDRVDKNVLMAFVKLSIADFENALSEEEYYKQEQKCIDMLVWKM